MQSNIKRKQIGAHYLLYLFLFIIASVTTCIVSTYLSIHIAKQVCSLESSLLPGLLMHLWKHFSLIFYKERSCQPYIPSYAVTLQKSELEPERAPAWLEPGSLLSATAG